MLASVILFWRQGRMKGSKRMIFINNIAIVPIFSLCWIILGIMAVSNAAVEKAIIGLKDEMLYICESDNEEYCKKSIDEYFNYQASEASSAVLHTQCDTHRFCSYLGITQINSSDSNLQRKGISTLKKGCDDYNDFWSCYILSRYYSVNNDLDNALDYFNRGVNYGFRKFKYINLDNKMKNLAQTIQYENFLNAYEDVLDGEYEIEKAQEKLAERILPKSEAELSKQKLGQIILMDACEEDEAKEDLYHSVESLKEVLEKNRIEIIYEKSSRKCGYLLKNDIATKALKGAMTDSDLYDEIQEFFKIKGQ